MASSCSTLHNHLDPISLKFKSQCSDTTFCSAAENGTCIPRKRASSLCLPGTFCPDEGSGCLPLVFIGGACQLNRDEQCALPPDMTDPDQVLCLGSVCTYSDVDTGRPCIADTTTYTDVFDDQHFTSTIIRDNCQKPQYYCEQVSMTCEPAKQLGFSCSIDNECQLKTCDANVCSVPPETPLNIQPWQMAVTVSCILGVLISTCLLLALVHKQHRQARYSDLRGYSAEQLRLRLSLIQMHSAAASSKRYS
ncbi:hypothetical protein CPB85DRAFT_1279062 [Mucidula mucida]|nr:hypothetical protein CPB85DRAFT_1279062 [Mucidula mucida]